MGNQKRKAEAERRRQQRKRTIALVVLGAVIVGAGAFYLLFIRESVPPVVASANAAEAFAGGETSLVYATFDDSQEVHRIDLESDEDSLVTELPHSGNTDAAGGSPWMSIVTAEERDGGGVQPLIYIFETESEQETSLGVGYDPTWSPDGGLLAWSEPADPSECRADECSGDASVQITDPESGDTSTLVEEGAYRVIGWAGEYVIIQDDTHHSEPILQSVSPDGELQELPIRPVDYWGSSPDGRWMVQSGDSDAMFFEMENGAVVGDGVPIGIQDGTKLGSGAWAHDSSYVAAFAAGQEGALDLVTFRPNAPEPVALTDGGQTSDGGVYWSPDNDGLVFQRFNGTELEAVHCPLEGECETVFSWTSGRSLLRLE